MSYDQQNKTSWGNNVPSQGSSGWGSSQPINQGSNFRTSPQDSNTQFIQGPNSNFNPNQGGNQIQQTNSVIIQGSEWGNSGLQQGLRQGMMGGQQGPNQGMQGMQQQQHQQHQQQGHRGGDFGFGTDNVFNDSHTRSGKRIPNMGFSNPQNNTPITNKIGEGMNVGILGNLLPTLFPNPCIKYKILTLVDTSMALDVASITDEKKKLRKGTMIIWTYHGGPNQQFYILPCGGKKVRIINAASGYSLEVPNNSSQDGAHLSVNPNNNSQNEEFELVEQHTDKRQQDIFMFKTFCGKVFDCFEQGESNGTKVIQWTQNGGKNQLWRITPA